MPVPTFISVPLEQAPQHDHRARVLPSTRWRAAFLSPTAVSRSFLQPPVGAAINFCAFCTMKRSFFVFKCAKALANLVNGSTLVI